MSKLKSKFNIGDIIRSTYIDEHDDQIGMILAKDGQVYDYLVSIPFLTGIQTTYVDDLNLFKYD